MPRTVAVAWGVAEFPQRGPKRELSHEGIVDAAIEIARQFSLKDVAGDIACPFIVTHGGNDRIVPVHNAPKLYEAVGARDKHIKIFSVEEGGAEHAHVDNRQVGIAYVADWLAEHL